MRNFEKILTWTLIIICSAFLLPDRADTEPNPSIPPSTSNTLKKPSWPPAGEKFIFPVTRDSWLSSVDKEKYSGNGGSSRLKLKGQQEYILLDFDLSRLKGKVVTGALLHVRTVKPRKYPFMRVGVSTLASEWIEGNSKRYSSQSGSSCFAQASYQRRNWAYPGSTLMDVCFGRGHTIWKFADASVPDDSGWQSIAVDPDVVAARIAGLSKGFVIYDEVGSTWSCKQGRFDFHHFPNRFCFSRESGKNAPWLEVYVEGNDSLPPDPVTAIKNDNKELPPGEALLSWETPADNGGGGTLGFQASYKINEKEKDIPRYLIPMASNPGETVKMYLQDLSFEPGEELELIIKPVDNAGNTGKPFRRKIKLSSNFDRLDCDIKQLDPFPLNEKLPVAGNVKVGVVDSLDKINPVTGDMIPERKNGYRGGNHIFSAKQKLVRLQAAKNEYVSFQLNLSGKAEKIFVNYGFAQNPDLTTELFQFAYVDVKGSAGKKPLPDPLVPVDGSISIPSKAGKLFIDEQTNASLICELYVPHHAEPGKHHGKLAVTVGRERQVFDVKLTVWDFTLPNKLSFVPEMNAYGGFSPYKTHEYYRLAHKHRTCLNLLPYGWSGKPAFAPEVKNGEYDWTIWDQKIGPLLDGSAFGDLPRKGEPVDVFYLPFNENWPVGIGRHYTPSYWADEAFSSQYVKELKDSFASFKKHFEEKKWYDTIFQFYLNNKIYYKNKYKKSTAPWIFDEPVNTQDFRALRWYGKLWNSALALCPGKAKMWFRADISYTQFQRDILKGVTAVEYIGGDNSQKTRMKKDEKILWGGSYFFEYGNVNKIEKSNLQPAVWCISAWTRGADGVLPWQTIGKKGSWKTAYQHALFYPDPEGVKPSIRLKSFRRGQQDVEYLTLFGKVFKVPRFAVTEWLEKSLRLKNRFLETAQCYSGTIRFQKIDPITLWRIRYQLGKSLDKKAPKYERSIVEWKMPDFDRGSGADYGYANPSPEVDAYVPEGDIFSE